MAVPASSTMVTCPKCGAASPVGTRFCNQCGAPLNAPAPLAAPPPPPPPPPPPASPPAPVAAAGPGTPAVPPGGAAPTSASAPPVDLRQRVDDDRGIIKRLQLLVPGYRSYREAEDIRAADELLRVQVADKVKNARATVENTRGALVQANQFQALNSLSPLIADLWRLEGEIRAGEQGFTGISPSVRIRPEQLDRLYEYDFGFAQAGNTLAQTISSLPGLASGPDASQVGGVIATARGQVNQLEQAFKARIQAIEGIRVG
jgi:hypothetical protein